MSIVRFIQRVFSISWPGLAYRSPISGTADRQALEIGLASGPSLVSLDKYVAYVQGPGPAPQDRILCEGSRRLGLPDIAHALAGDLRRVQARRTGARHRPISWTSSSAKEGILGGTDRRSTEVSARASLWWGAASIAAFGPGSGSERDPERDSARRRGSSGSSPRRLRWPRRASR